MIRGAFILSVGLGVGFTFGYATAIAAMPETREVFVEMTNYIKDMAEKDAAKQGQTETKAEADVESTAEETQDETPQEDHVG